MQLSLDFFSSLSAKLFKEVDYYEDYELTPYEQELEDILNSLNTEKYGDSIR